MKRSLWLDNARAFACMFVVLIHAVGPYMYSVSTPQHDYWIVANIIGSFARVCVPLFFMISGFIFFSKKKPSPSNFIRITCALLFYSFLAIGYRVVFINDTDLVELLIKLPYQPAFYHLWFFYCIIPVYLASYLFDFSKIDTKLSLVSICMLFTLFNPTLFDLFPSVDNSEYSKDYSLMQDVYYYILYAAAGAAIGLMRIRESRLNIIAFMGITIYIAASLCTMVYTHVTSEITLTYNEDYHRYTAIFVFVASIGAFLVFRTYAFRSDYIQMMLSFISRHSLVIYGIHAFFISFLETFNLRFKLYYYFEIPIVFLGALSLSIVVSLVVRFVDKKRLVS